MTITLLHNKEFRVFISYETSDIVNLIMRYNNAPVNHYQNKITISSKHDHDL